MDELSMVRGLLAEPPPSLDVVADGRDRLLRSGASTRPLRRARWRGALALAVTAAAAATVVATLLPGTGSSPGGGGLLVTDASARSMLLAAAVRAESAPATGTYWHVRTFSRTPLPQRFGRADDRYALEQLSVREEWTRRDGRAWSGTREWVRPKSPSDEAAWRRDGAPTKWCDGMTDTDPPRPSCLHTAPGVAGLTRNFFPFQVGEGNELTFAQLQQLPDDPGALRSWLVGITRRDLDPSASAAIVDANVGQILANLLVYPPVPAGVRAAAYRALAEMPGVTSIGSTHDELGRAGVGVRIPAGQGMFAVPGSVRPVAGGTLIRTLIIDPHTSHVLADEMSAGSRPLRHTAILAVGWTDEAPRVPALP
jgi:hypothetical protein